MALAQINNGVPGYLNTSGGVTYNNFDPATMSTAGQLQTLENSNNPLLQMAQQQGAQAAAQRGSLNGTLFAAASQNAAMQNLIPVAGQDAQANLSNATNNANAANQNQLERMQNNASLGVAGIGAAAQRYGSDNTARTAANALAQQQSQYTQSRAWALADQQTAQQNYARDATLNATLGTIFSDPSYWSNPQGAMGMMSFFQNGIDSLWNDQGGDTTDTGTAQPFQNSNPGNQQTAQVNP